ncbi:MAG: hypothetical protein SFT92_04525 [Rickettsiales bacterium]|nr:hypothetical protein [Rickettsiales bacterium]
MQKTDNTPLDEQLPAKPMKTWQSVAIGAVVGGAVYFIFEKIFDKMLHIRTRLDTTDGAILGGLLGYWGGEHEKEKYDLKVDNVMLRQQLKEKAFVEKITQENVGHPDKHNCR